MNKLPVAFGSRTGHFVEDVRFDLNKRSQAIARAENLSRTYGRPVYVVTRLEIGGDSAVSATCTGGDSCAPALLSMITA